MEVKDLSPQQNAKRQNYLEWEEYFMSIAFLSAQRSKDPRTQVGACIVNQDHKVVGIGYNGMPIGCSDDLMPWNRSDGTSTEKWLGSKAPYVCHAELNAVLNKNLADIRGCSIYVALFPCNMCAQIIIQSGIKEVIFYSDKYHHKPEFKASRYLLQTAGVKSRQLRPEQKKVIIDFEMIERELSETPTLPKLCSYTEMNSVFPEKDLPFSKESNTNQVAMINNNNACVNRKQSSLENHVEQQNHQVINEIVSTTPAVSPSQPIDISSVEFSFAVFSWLLIIASALLLWYA